MTGPSKRTVYIDVNVITQINRGNSEAARTLRRLLTDPTVDVRVAPWTYRELVDNPPYRSTAAANRLMLAELHIQQGAASTFSQRIEVFDKASIAISNKDRPLTAEARLGNAEIWSFDERFCKALRMNQKKLGVRVAPESQIPQVHGNEADYHVGRQLMGLEPVEISPDGIVTRRSAEPQRPASPLKPATPSKPSAPRQAAAPKFRIAVSRIRLTMSQQLGKLRGTGRAVGGAVAGFGLGLFGAYLQSRVTQPRIERDFQEKETEIQTAIAGLANEIATAAVASPGTNVYAIISFHLKYHLLWEPGERIEQTTYAGLTIDHVRISTHEENKLGDMPLRSPGKIIEIVSVSGTISIPLPVKEMFLPADLTRARIWVIENTINTMSLSPAELRRLNEERNTLLNRL